MDIHLPELPAWKPVAGGQPKYRQIARFLEDYLVKGNLPAGAKFFNDRVLAKHFGTTPVTMARSLNRLVARGLLTRRVGSGTFISHARPVEVSKLRIGVICHEEICADETYVTPMMHYFHNFWEERGYTVVTFRSGPERYQAFCEEYELSGVMIFVPCPEFAPAIRQLADSGIPTVSIGYAHPDLPGIAFGNDHRRTGQKVAEYLIQKGRRKIAFLSAQHIPASHQLLSEGCAMALYRANIPNNPEWRFSYTQDTAIPQQIQAWLETFAPVDRPDAIFIAYINTAPMIYEGIKNAGLRIPEDVAVIAFNDLPLARMLTPCLSVAKQKLEVIAESASKQLEALITGQPVSAAPFMDCTELIERESTKSI